MSLGEHAFGRTGLPRWLAERLWGVEHAFERARASGKAEDDTRLRIFFVLALFSPGFVTLARRRDARRRCSRTRRQRRRGRADRRAPAPTSSTATACCWPPTSPHYGLYVDPREIWDAGRDPPRPCWRALPNARARAAGPGAARRTAAIFLLGGLTPQERARVHDLGLPGVTFEPEQRRVYPLGPSAAHLIGFSDTGGEGLAGAELAFNDDIRAARRRSGAPMPLSIDLRVQARAGGRTAQGRRRVPGRRAPSASSPTSTPARSSAWPASPTFDPNKPGKAAPTTRR